MLPGINDVNALNHLQEGSLKEQNNEERLINQRWYKPIMMLQVNTVTTSHMTCTFSSYLCKHLCVMDICRCRAIASIMTEILLIFSQEANGELLLNCFLQHIQKLAVQIKSDPTSSCEKQEV